MEREWIKGEMINIDSIPFSVFFSSKVAKMAKK